MTPQTHTAFSSPDRSAACSASSNVSVASMTAQSVGPRIRRLHEAKQTGAPTVTIWGSGRARREFLAVDDLADASIVVMKHYSVKFLNVGTGQDIPVATSDRDHVISASCHS
ncbi:MAG: NAD-dependent epimerase/dehydratase family protein [Xanthobacteraceae bacterium]